MTKNWRKAIISETALIKDALLALDSSSMQVVLVVNTLGHLLGVVTDGDIRRGFLQNITMDAPVTSVMNKKPRTIEQGFNESSARALMKDADIHHLPVVNNEGELVDLLSLDFLLNVPTYENLVILMAGGLGSRLHPLTHECPKPLLKVAGKAIAELLLEEFVHCGFKNFYFCVNYMAEAVQAYFQDGSQWGSHIRYVIEEKRLGTAGALSLLPNKILAPIIVANADIITRLNFSQALDFHLKSKAAVTVCVRSYQHTVPYGVIKMEGDRFVKIVEKPVQDYFVSAGIYIINPELIEKIPPNEYYDMPDFITSLSNDGFTIAVYPICEYWLDVGRMEDLEKAHHDSTSALLLN